MKISIITVVIFFISLTIHAETVSIEDCISEAIANNPRLDQARARYEGALAQSKSVGTLLLPSIQAQFSYYRLSDVDPFEVDTPLGTFEIASPILDTYQAALSVRQPIFTGFKLTNQKAMTDKVADTEHLSLEKEQWDLRFEVINAYYNVIKSKVTRKVIEESVKAMQAHVEDVRNFKETGLATTNELLQTEVMLSNLKIRLNRAENGIAITQLLLKTLMNRPDETPIEIDEAVRLPEDTIPSLDLLVEKAFRARIELQQLEVHKKIADHSLSIAKSDYFPTLIAAGVYNYARPNSRYQPPEEDFNSDWSIGVTMSITPFDWGRTRYNMRIAKSQQNEINAQREQIVQFIRTDVTQAYLNYTEASRRLELVRTTVDQARENLKVAHDQYLEGMNRNTDVLDAETQVLQANLDRTQAEIDVVLTRAMLDKATGEFL